MPFPRARTIAALVTACTAVVPCVLALPSCTDAAPGTPVFTEAAEAAARVPREMRIVNSYGGAHRAMVIDHGLWFQTYANRLLVLEAETGTTVSDVELAPRGVSGPAVDLQLCGSSMFIVLERDAVVELDVRQPRAPVLLARWTPTELGIEPLRLASVDGDLLVSGDGGVVKLADAAPAGTSFDAKGRPISPEQPARALDGKEVGTVVASDNGAVACVGRRILRLATGEYLGAASMLKPMPPEYGGYAFVLQAEQGAEVGILGPDFKKRSSSVLPGTVTSLRVSDSRFIAVTEAEVAVWKLEQQPGFDATSYGDGIQLGTPREYPVKGAYDIGRIRDNRFAVAGSFGRALYRLLPEGDKPGDTFYWSERMPGRLDVAVSDRRRVLAAGLEGAWLYLIGEKAELVDRQISAPDPQSARGDLAWGSAVSDDDRATVVFRLGDRALPYKPSRAGLVSTIAVADGKVWIGHDHGIDVVGFDPLMGELICESTIRLAGPIIAIYPNRVGGGVNYVARLDGFGVIRPVAIDAPPTATKGTISAFVPVNATEPGTREGGALQR